MDQQKQQFKPYFYTFFKRTPLDMAKLKELNVRWFFGAQDIQVIRSDEGVHQQLQDYLKSVNAEIVDDTTFVKAFVAEEHPSLKTGKQFLMETFKCQYIHYVNQKQREQTQIFLLSQDIEQHKNVCQVFKELTANDLKIDHQVEREQREQRPQEQRPQRQYENRQPRQDKPAVDPAAPYQMRTAQVDENTRNLFKGLGRK